MLHLQTDNNSVKLNIHHSLNLLKNVPAYIIIVLIVVMILSQFMKKFSIMIVKEDV